MRTRRNSTPIPPAVLLLSLIPVLLDLPLQKAGILLPADLLLFFLFAALLLPFGYRGLQFVLLILLFLFCFQYRLQKASFRYMPLRGRLGPLTPGDIDGRSLLDGGAYPASAAALPAG